ncbi:protein monoglycylase TTLL8 [Pteronotus mesoamericanus]|uniref:protein monoglycylase TTLL8 n=1 Tax=Pteronotus mesoamericanus TaxID=1884717 RepID=UPI0023ED5346|nr:protein monoglycylase TTLL8 [Pteronotus parnellii mesoamericanus]
MARGSRRPSPRPQASPRRAADGSPDPSLAPRRGSPPCGTARAQRLRRSRSRAPHPTPPPRPRSPTPRAGRRSARPRPRRRRPQPAQCAEQPPPVSRGNRRTPGGAAGGGSPARSLGPILGAGVRARKGELPEARMDSRERKRLLSASSEGDWREDNKLKRGISQNLCPSPRLDRYKIAKQLTEKAIKEKKIFSIYGHYPVMRAALRRRGWVEKRLHLPPTVPASGEGQGATEGPCAEGKENQEVAVEETDDIHDVMSRLVKNEMPYFLWTIKRDAVDYHSLAGSQALNHYGRTASFTTKIGLCLNLRSLPWYVQDDPDTFFPRCYGLCSDSEKQEFLDDFRRTAASSILKWVVSQQHWVPGKAQSRTGEEAGDGDPGSQKGAEEDAGPPGLPGQLVGRACRACRAYLGQLEHEDIDVSEDRGLTEEEWRELTQQYYSLVHGDTFISNSRNHFSQCQALLNKISSVSPQTEIDGLRNIWIVKPAAKSRGRDIVCMDRVEEILDLVAADHASAKDNKWVVQKYIETPLLIYDTKFDIRQWFLVTDWNPLTIWFYKESYLRFSTQRFSLDNLDGAIHLCNNSIQKHLKNDKDRSPLLPCHNMWTSTKFQEYLQRKGRGSVWGSVIYPSMKRAVAHTMKVAADHVEPRKNSFELYGADFVLGRDFRPWLIEINSSPTMHASTPVTAQLCAQVQEDTIKVVVDRKGDRNCDVGNFELLWRQPAVDLPQAHAADLCVEGVSVRRARKHMPPTSSPRFSPPLLDIQPLKVRGPLATPGLAPAPLRTAAPQHLKLKDGKRELGTEAEVCVSLGPCAQVSEGANRTWPGTRAGRGLGAQERNATAGRPPCQCNWTP